MSNVVERLTPNPITHEHGENGCCPDPRAWEMEMMHQVWAAGLHDAANCFQNALEAKWKLESQQKVKPKTNGDRIRALPNEELDQILNRCCISYTICSGCKGCVLEKFCDVYRSSGDWLSWLRSPVEESNE